MSAMGIADSEADIIRNTFMMAGLAVILLLTMYIVVKRRQVKIKRAKRHQREEKYRIMKAQEKARWDQEYWSGRYR
jgi:hypothetical protein